MKKLLYIAYFLFICGNIFPLSAQHSPRIANYDIELQLDTTNKRINADQVLLWRNTSLDTIHELYFHLYYNAFKNSESTFFRERGVPSFLTSDIDSECGWSWIQVLELIDEEGNELMKSSQYVAPDDGNVNDQTVLKVTLINPVLPNSEEIYQIKWESKIPKTMPRTGYNKDFYFFSQWYPKVGVYEAAGVRYNEEGKWNCHQYHSSGEYYSDFGVYDVRITVPINFEVASTGELVGQSKKGNEMTWHFQAEDVIDFTWTCSPQFQIQEDSFNNTRIKLYTYPYKAHFADRYLPTIKHCMAYLEDHFSAYPYPTLSIIDPPIYGMYTGGMEYPTLITSLSFCFFPEGIRTPETLVVHEFIHQYFMQMVATHEVEDPWMDEGITSYYESRILDDLFGKNCSTIDAFGVKAGNAEYNRIEFFSSANTKIAPNVVKSWEFKHGGYGYISYNKTALWLKTMEGLLGVELMDRIMRAYFEKWKFKHPGRNDFIDVVNAFVLKEKADVFPSGMDWFFKQVLFGTEECDYAVATIENKEKVLSRGIYGDLENCEVGIPEDLKYESKVIFHRLGELKFPIDCVVYFDDGSSLEDQWDGQSRTFDISVVGNKKIVSAAIDPDRKIYLDKNFINNSSIQKKQNSKLSRLGIRILTSFQHLLETVALWV